MTTRPPQNDGDSARPEPGTQGSACVELTEGEEVCIVPYGMLSTSNLSLTDLHDTMVMAESGRLHRYGQVSFSSDGKWDGLDEFYVHEYDAATHTIVIVGDPIIIDR